MEKRTRQIAIRITQETDQILEREANKMKWTKASLANEILEKWAKDADNNGGAIQFIIHQNGNINIGR